MKKIIFAFVAVLTLAACSSRQVLYKGNIKLTQDRKDCVIELAREGDFANKVFNKSQKIVHKNTKCADMIDQNRSQDNAPARTPVRTPALEPERIPERPHVAAPQPVAEVPAVQPPVIIMPVRVNVQNETNNVIVVNRATDEMRARQIHSAMWSEPRPAPRQAGCRQAQPCNRPNWK